MRYHHERLEINVKNASTHYSNQHRTASEAHLLLQRKTNGPVISTCKHIFPD